MSLLLIYLSEEPVRPNVKAQQTGSVKPRSLSLKIHTFLGVYWCWSLLPFVIFLLDSCELALRIFTPSRTVKKLKERTSLITLVFWSTNQKLWMLSYRTSTQTTCVRGYHGDGLLSASNSFSLNTLWSVLSCSTIGPFSD